MHSNVNRGLFNWARVVARRCGGGVLVGYMRRDVRRISRKCQHRERDAYRTQFPNVRHDSLLDRFSLVAPIIIQVQANLLVSVRCKPYSDLKYCGAGDDASTVKRRIKIQYLPINPKSQPRVRTGLIVPTTFLIALKDQRYQKHNYQSRHHACQSLVRHSLVPKWAKLHLDFTIFSVGSNPNGSSTRFQ